MELDSLPLFPLHTVLFPRMPLPLRIFEDRYRRMLDHCLEVKQPFGVVLIQEGQEVGPPAVPRMAGTIAHIHAVQRMGGDSLVLYVVGAERFRIHRCSSEDAPYLVGRVETFQDEPGDARRISHVMEEVSGLFQTFFTKLVAQAGVDMPAYDLPDDGEGLSFVIAAILPVDNDTRQWFLELTDTAARLTREKEILEREIERFPAPVASPSATRLTGRKGRSFFTRN